MILSSCHDYSLNNDCHCHEHCHYMQRIYVYFILSSLAFSCLDLTCLVLSWVELTSITIVIIGMTLYDLVLHYIIISYHISCSFILSLLLIWSPFYTILFYSILFNSTLFQIDSIWFDLILLFYSILLDLIYCIVQYSISYQWMICVYLSVCPSVCLCVYLYE